MRSTNTNQLKKWHEEFSVEHPLRLFKKQKESFLDKIETELQICNYEVERIKARHFAIQNRLLLTKCEDPEIVFLAHYDTPTIMPVGFAPLYLLLGHTRQKIAMVLVVIFSIIFVIIDSFLAHADAGYWLFIYRMVLGLLFLVQFFIPNPHNAEDNTSGVTGLLSLADWSKDKVFKEKIQFVFLDNEEWGLIGSNALKTIWKKENHLHEDTLIINLDCISRGDTPLLIYHKEDYLAREIFPFLEAQFPQTKIINMKKIPLSDNYTFRKRGAVDISFATPAIIPGGFYIPDVHSPKDKGFSPEKTSHLLDALASFVQSKLSESSNQQ